MPKLKCDVRSCVYNADQCCCLSAIKVIGERADNSDETACSSFHRVKRKVNMDNIYKTEFARIDGINQFVSIECESRNCMYNKKELCTALRVQIAGGVKASRIDETICDTFVEKI